MVRLRRWAASANIEPAVIASMTMATAALFVIAQVLVPSAQGFHVPASSPACTSCVADEGLVGKVAPHLKEGFPNQVGPFVVLLAKEPKDVPSALLRGTSKFSKHLSAIVAISIARSAASTKKRKKPFPPLDKAWHLDFSPRIYGVSKAGVFVYVQPKNVPLETAILQARRKVQAR